MQFTRPAAGALVLGTSNPAASTHQHELTISLSHWISSNSPSLTLQRGVRREGIKPLPPRPFSAAKALEIRSVDSFTFSQPVNSGSTQVRPQLVEQHTCSPHSSSELQGAARAGHVLSSVGHLPFSSALAFCRSNAHAQSTTTLTENAAIAASHTPLLPLIMCRSRFAPDILAIVHKSLSRHFTITRGK